ncbi:MAG TPA: YraN family protein [Candidatus Cloacimonadota bacterium]|nr:YraN family protein [Candidatus Cloacimonadota bacterium]HPS38879.1 YraN family protein [Candidatus Cloacimonadota bacterium]
MNRATPNDLFLNGERLAAEFLERNGYLILERNYRKRCGEIDIIASRDGYIIFVEVKTRSHHSMSDVLANISYTKRKRITNTAILYLNQNPESGNLIVRFDVIIVFYYSGDDTYSIKHLSDAFLPVVEA